MAREKTYDQIRKEKIKGFNSEYNKLFKKLKDYLKRHKTLTPEEQEDFKTTNAQLDTVTAELWTYVNAFSTKDVELSLKLAKINKPLHRSCFYNASSSLSVFIMEFGFTEVFYVEGFIKSKNNTIIEHAWLEYAGGIVDSTLPEDDVIYIPVNHYTDTQMIKIIAKNNGETPLFQFVAKDNDNMNERKTEMLKADPELKCLSDHIPVFYKK